MNNYKVKIHITASQFKEKSIANTEGSPPFPLLCCFFLIGTFFPAILTFEIIILLLLWITSPCIREKSILQFCILSAFILFTISFLPSLFCIMFIRFPQNVLDNYTLFTLIVMQCSIL